MVYNKPKCNTLIMSKLARVHGRRHCEREHFGYCEDWSLVIGHSKFSQSYEPEHLYGRMPTFTIKLDIIVP